jgi:hypothetical protein
VSQGRLRRIAFGCALALAGGALAVARDARADWSGPTEVLSATWGSAPDQLGLGDGDAPEYDVFPARLFVASDGSLVLPDPENRRVVVRRSDGSVRAAFGPSGLGAMESEGWPAELFLLGSSLVTKSPLALQRYSLDGALLASADKVPGSLAGISTAGRIVVRGAAAAPTWTLFDDDLQVVGAVSSEPALRDAFDYDADLVREPDPASGGTRDVEVTTLRFSGATVALRDFRRAIDDGLRDGQGRVYVVTAERDPTHVYTAQYAGGAPPVTVPLDHAVVLELDAGGSIVGRLDLPPDTWEPVVTANPGDMTEPQPTAMVGGVTVDAAGNVYHWVRDAQRYRVLRWDRR